MPGYKPLPYSVTGPAADQARQAETRRKGGDPQTAVHLLEEALEASARLDPVLPGWLCGRLAALYRTLERYDDEVALLERYRDSQVTEDARVRYDARLSKARTIADRKRRRDSGAVASVRLVLSRPRSERTPVPTHDTISRGFSAGTLAVLCRAVAHEHDFPGLLDQALSALCTEARDNEISFEEIIAALKLAYSTREPMVSGYDAALLRVLSMYFERS
jgi:hypothetical protein